MKKFTHQSVQTVFGFNAVSLLRPVTALVLVLGLHAVSVPQTAIAQVSKIGRAHV